MQQVFCCLRSHGRDVIEGRPSFAPWYFAARRTIQGGALLQNERKGYSNPPREYSIRRFDPEREMSKQSSMWHR